MDNDFLQLIPQTYKYEFGFTLVLAQKIRCHPGSGVVKYFGAQGKYRQVPFKKYKNIF